MRLAVVLLVVWVGLGTAHAGTVQAQMGTPITSVDAAKQRVTIDRGSKHGLHVGDSGDIFPLTGTGERSPSLDERVARGKVVEVKDATAVLALDAVIEVPEVGAYFVYFEPVPANLAESALFNIIAMGVELRTSEDKTQFITLEQLLADPSQARRDKVLDAMIDEMKQNRDVIDGAHDPAESGKHRGETFGKVVDTLTRAELLDFFLYVEAFPGKFVGKRWKVPEIYFTWVINGTPSGERSRKLRTIEPTIAAAKQAQRAGKLDDARKRWRTVLAEIPDHSAAAEAIETIDTIQLYQRQLADDPDNSLIRARLVWRLYDLDANGLILAHLDILARQKFQPFNMTRMRGQVIAGLGKWTEAERIFAKLLEEKPDDKLVAHWHENVIAQGVLARAPNDPASYLALADMYYGEKEWLGSLKGYRKALELKGVTSAQRAKIKTAQQKIALQRQLDGCVGRAETKIEAHRVADARTAVAECLKLLDQLGEKPRSSEILNDLANDAFLAYEEELELELLDRRAQLVNDDNALYSFAIELLDQGRFDEAAAAAKKLVKPSPYLLAMIAQARGDLAELETIATKAAAASPKDAWPQVALVRVEAARGNWQDAVEHARKANSVADVVHIYQIMDAVNAATRGLQAHEALQAKPTSVREHLRLARALANLGLVAATTAEIQKLPADGTWRADAWWSLATSNDLSVPLAELLTAARNAKPTLPARKRILATLEARTRLRTNPSDEATRIALAKLRLEDGKPDKALAVLGPLLAASTVKPAVTSLATDARDALEARSLLSLAQGARDREDYAGATRMVLEFQKVADRINDVIGRTSAREVRSTILSAQGKYAEAVKYAEEMRAIDAADGDPYFVTIADGDVARLRAAMGSNEALRTTLTKTLQICDDLDNDHCLFDAHVELGNLDSSDGQLATGIEHMRKAWTLAEHIGDRGKVRNARTELASLDYSAGRYADAKTLYTDALAAARAVTEVDDEQTALLMLGAISVSLGDGKSARARFEEVYELGTRTGNNFWRAVARRLEGNAWQTADGDPAKAVVAFEQAAKLLEGESDVGSIRARITALRGLASSLLDQHERGVRDVLPRARKAADEALAIGQPFKQRRSLSSTHILLANIALAEGATDDAIARSATALELAQKSDDLELLESAWHVVAKSRAAKGQNESAATAFDKALEQRALTLLAVGGESARTSYLTRNDTRELYTDAVEQFLKLDNTTRAMEVLELSRDAQLKASFDPATVGTTDPALRARLDKYEQERERVRALQQQLQDAANLPDATRNEAKLKTLGDTLGKSQQELKRVAGDLKSNHQVLYRVMAVDPQRLLDRRKQLPAGAVLVEYYAAEDSLYAFVMTAADAKPTVVRTKVKSTELATTVSAFRTAVLAENERVHARDKVEQLGRTLDDWLLQPLRKQLEHASTIIIVPFGPLYYLPFDALVTSEPKKPVRYAIEDYRFSVQTAMTIERLLEPARPRATGTLLAISNPDGSLPGAEREVKSIAKTFPDARILTRKQATLKAVTDVASGSRYIHMASHGILDPDPWKSYLKLADGKLTVSAISKLDGLRTSTEMVVLSACESATAEGSAGTDELMSLAGGFAWAGAPAIVASLWEVGDDSTAELMSTFYRALEANQGDRLESLRNAKLNLLRFKHGTYAAPWYWASFELFGDFRAPAKP